MSYRRRGRATTKTRIEMEARAVMARPERAAADDVWTGELVAARLHEAMRTVQRAVSRPGPKEYGNSMPEPERAPLSNLEMIEQMSDPTLHAIENTIKACAMSEEVSRAEEAITWPGRYLVKAWPGPNRVLVVWLRAVATGHPVRKAMREAGYSRTTYNMALSRAFDAIADGLRRDGVQIR